MQLEGAHLGEVGFTDVCSGWLEGTHKECALSPQDFPVNFQHNCTVAGDYTTRMSMVPNKWPTGLPLNGYGLPMDDPPQVPGGTCNFAMPDDSTRDRYLWVSVCPFWLLVRDVGT